MLVQLEELDELAGQFIAEELEYFLSQWTNGQQQASGQAVSLQNAVQALTFM